MNWIKKLFTRRLKCKKCNGNLVASPFPEWVRLNDKCKNYLKRVEL